MFTGEVNRVNKSHSIADVCSVSTIAIPILKSSVISVALVYSCIKFTNTNYRFVWVETHVGLLFSLICASTFFLRTLYYINKRRNYTDEMADRWVSYKLATPLHYSGVNHVQNDTNERQMRTIRDIAFAWVVQLSIGHSMTTLMTMTNHRTTMNSG